MEIAIEMERWLWRWRDSYRDGEIAMEMER